MTLSDEVLEVIAYLQDCFDKLERGEEDLIVGDPYYDRSGKPPLSDEDVSRIIDAIDAEFAHEIHSYLDYHRNRSGANWTPDFWRLSPRARRAMVETIDAMLSRHAAIAQQKRAAA